MLLDKDRDRNIDFLGKKVSIFCRTHIAVGHRIQGGRPGPLRLRSAASFVTLLFLSKNHVYKNVEAQIAKKIRTF